MTSEQPPAKEDLTPFQLIRFLISCVESGEKLTHEDYALIGRCQRKMKTAEQQLAEALALLAEELPYEERTSGYHAEEWSARVRALLALQAKEASE